MIFYVSEAYMNLPKVQVNARTLGLSTVATKVVSKVNVKLCPRKKILGIHVFNNVINEVKKIL